MIIMQKAETNQNKNHQLQMLQIAIIALILAALTVIHQYISWHKVWEWNQVIHHENITIALISFSLGILITLKYTKQ